MNELDVDIEALVHDYLLARDKVKLRKYNRDHDHANMVKRKTKEHEQLRKELMQKKTYHGRETSAG